MQAQGALWLSLELKVTHTTGHPHSGTAGLFGSKVQQASLEAEQWWELEAVGGGCHGLGLGGVSCAGRRSHWPSGPHWRQLRQVEWAGGWAGRLRCEWVVAGAPGMWASLDTEC